MEKKLIARKDLGEGRVELQYPDRKELHSWEDLPMVTFLEPRPYKDIESIDIDKDIPDTLDYIPVSHNLYFHLDQDNLFGIFDYLQEKTAGEYSIHGEITSPLDYFLDTLGYENGLIAMMLDPEKCEKILAKYTVMIRDLAVAMCQKDIDAIKISSPFAGMGFISTDFYRQFVLPFEKQIVQAIRQTGKHAYIHTCRSIGDHLEVMCESGLSGLECLDPPPVGNVDLEDAFNRVGDRIFIKGNIDSVNTLLLGDDEKVRRDVGKIIEIGKRKGKGFILSTACSIAPKVSEEHLLMLSQLIEEQGYY